MHDLGAFINRLRKVYKQRRSWAARNGFEAYRLYDHDIPELRYIVDLYGRHAVIYDRTRAQEGADRSAYDDAAGEGDEAFEGVPPEEGAEAFEATPSKPRAADTPAETELIEQVAAGLGLEAANVHLKKRRRMPGSRQYQKLGASGATMAVREGEPRYLVNLVDYLDTGLFLDHRPLRLMFARTPHARLLNLFCYTGSVSVAAASAGAHTTSVDLSSTYLEWARENFKLNELSLDRHRFVRADARTFLAEGPGGEPLYDVIFLDPPTFSNSKRMKGSFDVQRDHGVLIDHALRFLAPGGTLYFSTNRLRFQLDERFGRRKGIVVTDCTDSTIPEDFRDRKIHRCFRFVHEGRSGDLNLARS